MKISPRLALETSSDERIVNATLSGKCFRLVICPQQIFYGLPLLLSFGIFLYFDVNIVKGSPRYRIFFILYDFYSFLFSINFFVCLEILIGFLIEKNLTKDFCFSCSLFTALSIQNSYVTTFTGHFAGHVSYLGRIVLKAE